MGRFIGVDPLADHPNQVDKSPYAYAWNNPVALTDPDGNCPLCPAIPWIIAAGEALFEAAVFTTAAVTTAVVVDEVIDHVNDRSTDTDFDTTDDDTDNGDNITLYRGVGTDKPAMHKLAMMGTAIPLGLEDGHDDPELHNDGDNWSIFTSWSVSETKATEFALSNGPGGVVMSKTFKISETVPSPDQYNEGEVLVPGIVRGAAVKIKK